MYRIKTRIALLALTVAVLLTTTSCDSQYEELFTNPEQSTNAKVEYLFTELQTSSDLMLGYWEGFYLIYDNLGPWAQVTGAINDEHMMDPNTVRWGATWENYYTRQLMLYKEMQTVHAALPEADKPALEVYLHLGKVINAYNLASMTDLWGDLPYSEAGTARNASGANYSPKYDAQKDLYYTILDDLKAASDALKDPALVRHSALNTQDFMLKGDLVKWQKFANSLRLRYAIRLAEVDASKAQTVVSEILNGAYPIIENNADNILWPNSPNHNSFNDFGQATREMTGSTYAPKIMLDLMVGTNDPRIPIYFDPNLNGQYVGLPSSPKDQGDVNRTTYARNDSLFFDQNSAMPFYLMTAAEVAFLKAEAYQRNWATGNAQQEYNRALTLSVQMYYTDYNNGSATVDLPMTLQAEIDAFIAATGFNGLQSIGTQKWIHFGLLQPYEAWNELRRLDYPALPPDISGSQTLARTVRVLYPSSEVSNNPTGYGAVKDKDQTTTRVWWDVR